MNEKIETNILAAQGLSNLQCIIYLKFSAVRGTISANNSNLMRPISCKNEKNIKGINLYITLT